MDPRDRADALLSRARARGAFVVTPEDATSPMDSANTQQIARSVVRDLDRDQDPDTTTVLSAAFISANETHVRANETHPGENHLDEAGPTTRLDSQGGRGQQSGWRPSPTPRPRPEPEPAEPVEEEVGGLIPTVKQSSGRSSLSRRLDGI